ncbi:MAG: hypothetical protein ACRD1L_11285 [Terriglobales bacterium]
MSDHIRLSLWFPTQTAAQVLPHLQRTAETLPSEAVEGGVRELSVVALDWSQTPLFQMRYERGIPLAPAIEQMREFVQEDCACEIVLAWLLWIYGPKGWEQAPQPVRVSSLGPSFEPGLAKDEGQVVVDFGLDEVFLAELAPWDVSTRRHLQANILQLLAFTRMVEEKLRPQNRRLWSEGEENWTTRLLARIEQR